jgi:hypothetical protein
VEGHKRKKKKGSLLMFRFTQSNQFGKYNVSHPVDRTRDGIVFASKAEMRRYDELQLLVKANVIKDLICQPKFELVPEFTLLGKIYAPMTYVGDFQYYNNEKKKRIVEDVKGVETDVFKMKEKLMAYRHHIQIVKVIMLYLRL